MRVCAIAWLLVLGACGTEVLLPGLPADPNAQTEVLAYGPAGGAPEAHFVVDLRGPTAAIRFDLPDEPRRFEAFLLNADVDELGVAPGQNTLPSEGPLLPSEAYTAFASSYAPGDDLQWGPEPNPQWTDLLRFPALSARGCLVSGGCFIDGQCRRPCEVSLSVAPPMAPQAPRWTCPQGWRPRALSSPGGQASVEVCEPWPSAVDACADESFRRPGVGCEPLYTTCPVDTFAPDEPASTVFVAAGAADGNGTRERPWGSLQAALQVAVSGQRIALGAGEYEIDGLALTSPVTLAGRCPRDVTLRGVLHVRTATVAIEGVRWVGGLRVQEGAAQLVGVRIDGDDVPAVEVRAGRLQFDRLRVVSPRQPGLRFAESSVVQGRGLDVTAAPALEVIEGATLTLEEASAWRTGTATTAAVRVRDATFVGRRFVWMGLGADFEDADVALTDVVLRDATFGLRAVRSSLTVSRWWVDGVGSSALSTQLGAIEVVDGVFTAAEGAPGSLLGIDSPGARFERMVWWGDIDNAANISRDVSLTDLDVRGMGVSGVTISGGRCTLTRLRIQDVGTLGLFLRRSDGQVVDLSVANVGRNDCATVSAVELSRSSVTTERLAASDIQGVGVRVVGGTWRGRDVSIVRPSAPGCGPGVGVGVELDGAAGDVNRFEIRGASHAGIRVFSVDGAAAALRASEGRVTGGPYGLDIGLVDFPLPPLLDRVDYSGNDDPIFESAP